MSATGPTVRVLFVCMGNICRSPTAHAVFARRVQEAGLEERIAVDSAGTHGFHVGDPPDERAQAAAAARGYDLSGQRAREVEPADLQAFDYVIAMDRTNRALLESLAGGRARSEPALLLDFAREHEGGDVPDPYYGAINGFEEVLDLVEVASEGLLEEIRRRHRL